MNKNAQRVFITGASGSGKSTWVKAKLKEYSHVVIFDPLDEYARELKSVKRVTSLQELRAGMKQGWQNGFKTAFVPPQGNLKTKANALHKLSEFLLAAQEPYFSAKMKQQLCLVVEEMNLSFPIQNLPEEYWGFGEICSRGRHYGINVLGVSQRVAEVNTRFRGNCDFHVIFRCADWVDIKTRAQQLGPSVKEQLEGLQVHEFLKVDQNGIEKGQNSLKK